MRYLLLLLLIVGCSKHTNAISIGDVELTPEQTHILLLKGTDPKYTGPLVTEDRPGVYVSWITGDVLFRSEDKRVRGHGWPDFVVGTNKVSNVPETDGTGRLETIETSNGTHLGHYLQRSPTEWYYCINGNAIKFIPN